LNLRVITPAVGVVAPKSRSIVPPPSVTLIVEVSVLNLRPVPAVSTIVGVPPYQSSSNFSVIVIEGSVCAAVLPFTRLTTFAFGVNAAEDPFSATSKKLATPVILAVPAIFRPCAPFLAVAVPVNVNRSTFILTVVSFGKPSGALATVRVIVSVKPVEPVPPVTEEITKVPVSGDGLSLLELKGVRVFKVMVEV